jgi:cytochrome P450
MQHVLLLLTYYYKLTTITGQVTTASAITWMVKYLADNKVFQETLRVGGSIIIISSPPTPDQINVE